MPAKTLKKFSSFTVMETSKNVLIPFDEYDKDRPFSANIVTNQGYSGKITRNSDCIHQEDGRYEFTVEITYLEGSKKGRTRQATVKNYTPSGRYGELFR